jgi:hypothetical protein
MTTPIASAARIAERTKLCVLETGAWRATKKHKAETQEENARHNTDAARVLVKLTNNHALHGIYKLDAAAYQDHKRLTLPSAQPGMRLLPNGREFEHADRMRELSDQRRALVSEFLAAYDGEKAAAPARLNGLYDASMWPPHEIVASKFVFRTRYLATPTDGGWADWLTASAAAAEEELRARLREALERVRDRVGADGKLYASVFDSIRDLTALVSPARMRRWRPLWLRLPIFMRKIFGTTITRGGMSRSKHRRFCPCWVASNE